MQKELFGKSIYEGIVIAKAHIYSKPEMEIEKKEISATTLEDEKLRLGDAIKKSQKELKELKENLEGKVRKAELEILMSHILMLGDPEFKKQIFKFIENELVNAEWAVKVIADKYFQMFDNMKDPIYNQKKIDVRDIASRLISNLLYEEDEAQRLSGKILVAKEIYPSELLKIAAECGKIEGIVLEYGGETSHVAILAKSLEIPTLLGVNDIDSIKEESITILDTRKGIDKIILGPEETLLADYAEFQKNFAYEKSELEKNLKLASETVDGKKISLKINVSGIADVFGIEKKNPDGIGLFRTELMYMEASNFPSEEEQVEEYLEVINKFPIEKEIIIRTLDIGADKQLPYLQMNREDNPFLGVRGIRHSLRNEKLFREQLRAILRVAYGRNVKIMYPMITNLKETLAVKKILEECKRELELEGKKYCENIEQGIMIEVPSAVFISDLLAPHVDFFSIGTNDLTQYILAADRMSEALLELYDSYEPAVLRAINQVADSAKKYGKGISICGEMAGEELAAVAFLSMGIYDLSMVKSSLPKIKKMIRGLDTTQLGTLREEILSADDGNQVKAIIYQFIKDKIK